MDSGNAANRKQNSRAIVRPSRLCAGILALALTLALAGCAADAQKSAPAHDDSLQRVLDAGQLVLGLDGGFLSMGFADESGELVGFDIDAARAVCDRLGVRLVLQTIDWDAKEDALNSGAIDCIWSAMSITPARAEAMTLSEPYMQNELIFLVPGSSDARSPWDLKGRTVGVQPGTTGQEALEASDIYADITVALGDYRGLLRQLQDGELDAVLIDSTFAYYFIFTTDEQFYVLSDSLGEEEYAIGFRKGDQALRDKVQELIEELAAEGTLGDISRKWFGSDITIVW